MGNNLCAAHKWVAI